MLKGQWWFYCNLSVSGTTKSFRFAIGMSKGMDGWMDGCGAMLSRSWIILS